MDPRKGVEVPHINPKNEAKMFCQSQRAKWRWPAQETDNSEDLLSRSLVTLQEPTSAAAEAYRTLRTRLLYTLLADVHLEIIVLTSPGPREGKSTVCANLGAALAQVGKSTLIVDCARKPSLHTIFGLPNEQGLANVLMGEQDPQETWQEPLLGLNVLTAGPTLPDLPELLISRGFAEFLSQMRQQFEYVLLDTSPVVVVSDPVVLATQSDGVLLVLDAQNTRKEAVRQSVRSLEAAGGKVLGTIINYFGRASKSDRYP